MATTENKFTFPSSSSLKSAKRLSSLSQASPITPSTSRQETEKVSAPKGQPWYSLNWDVTKSEWDILIASTALKLLLFPAYHSTDFEVHRNWLAITHSLPISKWYYEATSEWTLDYPPFFAYFEWLLSIPAALVDRKIVDVKNLNYDAWSVIAFQRSTVIITELVLAAALLRFIRGSADTATQRIISASLFLHPGFLIVDHIHFQYNGFMFGILLWSILRARNGDLLGCGFFFAVLLNFKHIYMYQAPAYFIYLFRAYCMSPQGYFLLPRFLSLANIVIAVFVLSIGPFMLMGQLPQLFSRLFPFKRGLNHAYWAPNTWALVTALDRILLKVVKMTGAAVDVNAAGVSSTSRGLVGDTVFAVLPNIKPLHTFLITIAFQSIFLVKLWRYPSYKSFLYSLTLCGYVSYMFGWHVHEKAILLVLVPLSLLAAENHAVFRTFMIASVAGIYSLFPLLFTPAETPVKLLYSLLWVYFTMKPLVQKLSPVAKSFISQLQAYLEQAYLLGFGLLHFIIIAIPILLTSNSGIPDLCEPSEDTICLDSLEPPSSNLDFLPLMLTSVYCAIGIAWAFVRLSYIYLKASFK